MDYEEEYFDKDMKERNVYSKKTREDLVEDDQISAEEEAFMAGYDESGEETEEEPSDEKEWSEEE